MGELWLHWRRAHITDDRTAALRAVLAEHPGADPVIVVTSGRAVRLGVSVDGQAGELAGKIREATEPAVTIRYVTADA